MRATIFLLLAFFLPFSANATVIINEVAWMGTSVSPNAEWMELYNTGSDPIDITGWRLIAGNGSPSIILTGLIRTNEYFLLERTSDATVPNISANQIYTGALINSGTTLSLINSSGSIVDYIDGGSNWMNIGGDNASKNTAQRTNNGWETATPTPGARNYGVLPPQQEVQNPITATTTDATQNILISPSGAPPKYMPIPSLRIITGKDRTVSVGADTIFSARVYDNKGNRRDEALVSWSFGDGMQRVGGSVYHSFYSPGEYLVVVHAKTPDGGEALEQRTITAKDASLKITSISSRGISLTNNGQRILDISLWRISMGGREFKIPENTQILSGRTVLFPAQVIQLPLTESASLLYPSGEVAAIYPDTQPLAQPASLNNVQAVVPAVRSRSESIISATKNIQKHEDAKISAPTTTPNTVAAVGAVVSSLSDTEQSQTGGIFSSSWFLGLLGVIALAGASLGFL